MAHLLKDVAYRTLLFARISLGMHLISAITKAAAGIALASPWMAALAGYYFLLFLAKFILLRTEEQRGAQSEASHARRAVTVCGRVLLLLAVLFAGIVWLTVSGGYRFARRPFPLMAVALYDIWCLLSSLIFLIGSRHRHSPVVVCVKYLRLAASLVSLFSLQSTVMVAFGNARDPALPAVFNTFTGCVVTGCLLGIGVYLVHFSGCRHIRTKKER